MLKGNVISAAKFGEIHYLWPLSVYIWGNISSYSFLNCQHVQYIVMDSVVL